MDPRLQTAVTDVVILCGGMGTRLRGVEKDKPKPMVDFNGRPFLDLLIDYVGGFGYKRFILCSGHKGNLIEEYFKQKKDDKTYQLSRESRPLGTAGAIKHAEAFITSDTFLAMNGDSFCPVNLNSLLDFHYTHNALTSIALVPMKEALDYGGVVLGEENRIERFNEKTATSSGWVNAGIYIFRKKILDRIPAGKPVSLEKELFPSMIGQGLFGFTSESRLLDIGTPERLELARTLLNERN